MDKNTIFSINSDVTYGRGYVYSLQYHIVFVTKYRKPVLTGQVEADVKKHLLTTLQSLDMELIAMESMPDHVHMLVSCKPQLRLSDAVKVLKGNTARWLFLSHPEIKKSLWGGHLPNELERKIYVESMIHRTKDNPIVLYDFDDRFYQCMYMLHYA